MNLSKFVARSAENWLIKALSIALALVLFVFHRMSMLEDRFFFVPLEIELSQDLVPASPYTRMIRVTLRGDANSIKPILEDDVEVYLDLKSYTKPGTCRAPVKIRKLGTALGVEPLQISTDPMEIVLELDRRMSKYVPVTANLRGELQSGYELMSHSLNPAQVVVDGPMQLLNTISELHTDFIELDGRSGDFAVTVSILNRDPLLTIRGNALTEFRGFVRKPLPVRVIDKVPISVKNLDPRFRAELQPAEGRVRIEGNQAALNIYTPSPSLMSVDCAGLAAEGEHSLRSIVALPVGLDLLQREPDTVQVKIRLKEK